MGIFTTNTTNLGSSDYTVAANESYSGIEGAMQILIDGAKNDQAIFESFIATDMTEIDLVKCNESAKVAALNEATGAGIFSRIKEFFKKMWEKLKGIIVSFINKLKAKFTSDNAKLVSKYGKDVRKKTFGKNFTYKYSEKQDFEPKKDLNSIKEVVNKHIAVTNVPGMSADQIKTKEKEISNGKVLKAVLQQLADENAVTADNFAEKFHKKMYKNEKECRGLESGRLSKIMKNLENGNETVNEAKELQSDVDDFCKGLIEDYDELSDKYADLDQNEKSTIQINGNKNRDKDLTPGVLNSVGSYTTKNSDFTKAATLLSKIASVIQTACTKYTTAYLKEVKFGIAQDRKVFIKAIGWRESQNESAEDMSVLFDAIDESVDYELSELI